MDAICWSDYLCPWCYVGTDRTAFLRSLGVSVLPMPYELHPEIPVGGRVLPRPPRWSAIAEEAAEAGLPFDPPDRLPNTRRVLEVSAWVRHTADEAGFVAFEAAVFRAHFAEQRRIDDEDELASFVTVAGLDPDDAFRALATGKPSRWVDRAMALARDGGVTGTPAWMINGLVVPGLQPRSFFERVVRKLQSRA